MFSCRASKDERIFGETPGNSLVRHTSDKTMIRPTNRRSTVVDNATTENPARVQRLRVRPHDIMRTTTDPSGSRHGTSIGFSPTGATSTSTSTSMSSGEAPNAYMLPARIRAAERSRRERAQRHGRSLLGLLHTDDASNGNSPHRQAR